MWAEAEDGLLPRRTSAPRVVQSNKLLPETRKKQQTGLEFGVDFFISFAPRREKADPRGTAIPGQPVAKAKQAPAIHRVPKISLISLIPSGDPIRY